ncbi:MAG: glycogen/starch synthase [Thalassotalea sp.]|nr:glycogen/starch synthase [Thalassotalea sp.]
MAASENDALPKGKVGGIGDVIRDIPKFLAQQNVHVDVLVPSYQYQSVVNDCELALTLEVPFHGEIKRVELFKVNNIANKNVCQWVFEHSEFCVGEPGQIYFDDGPHKPFCSDSNKFALFSAAVCELMCTAWFNKIDVLHLHDWHTAFVPLLREYEPRYVKLKSKKLVYSIHNLAIQGTRPLEGDEASLESWFPTLNYDKQTINDPRYTHCINPTRTAINLADAVHVVSPNYAKEVMQASDHDNGFVGGEWLEQDLIKANKQGRLFGFINGCDYDFIQPKPMCNADLLHKIVDTIESMASHEKYEREVHKIASNRVQHWLKTPSDGPSLVSIGRLTEQKVKLLLLAEDDKLVLDSLLELLNKYNARLIILGSGDPVLEDIVTQVMQRNNNLLFINGYCDNLSQNLYVNGDLFVMPSSFEPCGISQMLAMRAGQPCIAHKIGGLADTIEHLESGYLFSGATFDDQISDFKQKLDLALRDIQANSSQWQHIKSSATKQRFYWQSSIKDYIEQLYKM